MTTKYFNEGDSSTTAAQWLNFNTVYNEVMLLFSVESYMMYIAFHLVGDEIPRKVYPCLKIIIRVRRVQCACARRGERCLVIVIKIIFRV